MRRALAWLLALPIVAAGLLADHLFTYRFAVSDGERARELATTGHGWLAHAPLLFALCLALAAVCCALIAATARRDSRSHHVPLALALLPPVAYLVHEYVELAIHDETLTPHLVIDRPAMVGLALQIPFGIVALVLARVLGSLAEKVGQTLFVARRPVRLRAPRSKRIPTPSDLPRIRVLALHSAGRAPPAASLVS